jgi:hypothetical protein
LRGCHQAIILLGQRKQFVHAGAHRQSMNGLKGNVNIVPLLN